MRAKYLGQGVIDNYKGVSLKPGCEFEVTEGIRHVVTTSPLFEIVQEEPETVATVADIEAPRKRGRPRKDA